jgi:hypothetical protein
METIDRRPQGRFFSDGDIGKIDSGDIGDIGQMRDRLTSDNTHADPSRKK